MPDAASTQMLATAPGSPPIQQGATTNGQPLSASPAQPDSITPFVLPTGQQASHPIMDFIHNVSMAQLGIAGQQMAAQEHEKAQQREILGNALIAQPQLAASQDFMKTLGKYATPEVANALGQYAQTSYARNMLIQKQMQATMGSSGVGTTPAQAGTMSDHLNELNTQIAKGEQALTMLGSDPGHYKTYGPILEKHIENLRSQRDYWLKESPEAQAAGQTATTNARIGAETSPENAKKQVGLAASKSGAEASARLGQELSSSTIGKKAQLAGMEEAARGENKVPTPVDPLVETKRKADAEATLGKQYESTIEQPPLGKMLRPGAAASYNERKQQWIQDHFGGSPTVTTGNAKLDDIIKRHAGL